MADLILEDIYGVTLLLEDKQEPVTTQEPVLVEVWSSNPEDPVGSGQLLGVVPVGETLKVPFAPEFDTTLRLSIVSIAESGARSSGLLSDAPSTLFTIQRETLAPVIGQVGDALNLTLTVGVDNFSRYARLRKVEVADDEEMTVNLQTTIKDGADEVSKELPRFETISRASGSAALTKYVRISHSAGTGYGPYSNVLEVTFANSGGVGGSAGNFDPIPRGEIELILD